MTTRLIDQKRKGLLPEHKGVQAPVYTARATIPVIEALTAGGARVEPLPSPEYGYRIALTSDTTIPAGIVAVHLNGPGHNLGLRLENEGQYPHEFPDYWSTVDFTGCPKCGAPVVWYEANYVPGYRVCSRPPHHHSMAK
jgi:hypothetical protein